MMSIETYLTDKMVINTKELSELLGRTPRTLITLARHYGWLSAVGCHLITNKKMPKPTLKRWTQR